MSLFEVDAFGYPRPIEEKLSYGQRLTIRRQADIDAGRHPLTGLPLLHSEWGFTCGTCAHLFEHQPGNRPYVKCDLNATRGPATDVRKGWPACTRYRIEAA